MARIGEGTIAESTPPSVQAAQGPMRLGGIAAAATQKGSASVPRSAPEPEQNTAAVVIIAGITKNGIELEDGSTVVV